MRRINEECSRQIGQELEEDVIQQVMASGKAALPERYMNIIRECLRDFTQKVYNTLKEHGYNLDVIPIVFAGGGAAVMRLFGPHKEGTSAILRTSGQMRRGMSSLAGFSLRSTGSRLGRGEAYGKIKYLLPQPAAQH